MAFLISSSNAYKCCDSLNSGANSGDCTCSDTTGALGTCSCTSSPNSRAGSPCIVDSNGDSVNIHLRINFLSTFYTLFFFKCECCLEGGGGNKGCGDTAGTLCTAFGTGGTGSGMCQYHGGSSYDNIASLFLIVFTQI